MAIIYRFAPRSNDSVIIEINTVTDRRRFIPVSSDNSDYLSLLASGAPILPAEFFDPDIEVELGTMNEVVTSGTILILKENQQGVLYDMFDIERGGTLVLEGTLILEE